jgi:hypothetical protein
MSSSDKQENSPLWEAMEQGYSEAHAEREQKETNPRSVRVLMQRLKEMTEDNPATLDFEVKCYSEGDWLGWDGNIYNPDDDSIGFEEGPTDAEAERLTQIRAAEEMILRQEHWYHPEVLEAKEKGILP